MGGGLKVRARLAKDAKLLPILDLPSPVWCILLQHHLSPKDRIALFRSSRLLSELVIKHAAQVTLSPSLHLIRDTTKRETAFGLCKACANVHMVVRWLSPVLPSQGPLTPLLAGITHLTLHHIVLNSHVIRNLQLARLCNLRSLALTTQASNSWSFRIGGLDADMLSECVHAQGGLQALRSVRCEAADESDLCTTLEKLGSVVGSQLTHLTMNLMAGLRVLPKFTALRCLHVTTSQRQGAAEGQPATPLPKPLLTNLFTCPHLCEVIVPSLGISDKDDYSKLDVQWDLLQLQSAVTAQVLARLPLAGIQRVQVYNGFHFLMDSTEDQKAALQNVLKNRRFPELLPVTNDPANILSKGLPKDVPTLSIHSVHLNPDLINLLHSGIGDDARLPGALELMCVKVEAEQVLALELIPQCIHTLCLTGWVIEPPLTWLGVWGHMPASVDHLILNGCDVTQERLTQLFDACPTLLRLTLTPQLDALDWIFQHEHEVAAVADEYDIELIVHRSRGPDI